MYFLYRGVLTIYTLLRCNYIYLTVYDYNDLRAEAAIHAKLRAEAFQKAAEARGRKQGELAMHYAQQVYIESVIM